MNEHFEELAAQAKRFAVQIQQIIAIDLRAPDAEVQMVAHIVDCRERLQMITMLFDQMERELGGEK